MKTRDVGRLIMNILKEAGEEGIELKMLLATVVERAELKKIQDEKKKERIKSKTLYIVECAKEINKRMLYVGVLVGEMICAGKLSVGEDWVIRIKG